MTRKGISNYKKSNFDWTKQKIKIRTKVIKHDHQKKENGFLNYVRSLLF